MLEAGAGTGKTAVLVARVISWCVGAGWARAVQALHGPRGAEPEGQEEAVAARVLERTVAITFTERAAAEMEQRVTDGFAELVRGGAPCGLPRSVLVAAAGSEALLAQRSAALLAASDSLAVSTFHALCRRWLARYPLAAGVHPAFEVDADGRRTAALIDDLLQARAREAYGDPGDERWTALAALGLGARQLATALRALVASGVPAAALQGDEPYAAARVADFCAQLAPPLSGLLAALHAQPVPAKAQVKVAQRLAAACAALATTTAVTPAIEQLVATARPLLRGPLRERVRQWAGDEFGKGERLWLGQGTADASAACTTLGPLLDQLGRCDPLRLRLLAGVLGELLSELQQRLRQAGVVGFSQLMGAAHALLRDQPRVLEQVREGLDQLLVDEFQDTDPMQVAIVEALALRGEASRRPGLLVVGDAKQSIYGWRNADLAAYEDFVERVVAQHGLRCRLSLNFRSQAAILAEVERAIEPVMRAARGLQPRFERLVCAAEPELDPPQEDPAAAGRAPASAVEYWVSWEMPGQAAGEGERTTAARANALEAELLVRDLLAQGGRPGAPRWGASAVLLRTTTAQEVYLQALRQAGIPYVVERDRGYYRRREIIDATTLVRVVADANDHVALVAWLRAPAIGVPDAALLPLWQHDLPARLTALARPDPALLAAVDQSIAAAEHALPPAAPGPDPGTGAWGTVLRVAVRALAELRWALRHEPVDRFVERLRLLLGAEPIEAARFLGERRLANLERFFAELERQLLAGEGGLQGLLRALRSDVADRREAAEAPASEGSEGAVRVMTLHKAKGLTFDTVYLLGLHTRPGAAIGTAADECVEEGSHWEWRFAGAETLGFARIHARRQLVAAAEAVRTLYVGMTRPRRRLVLAGCWPGANDRRDPRLSHLDLLQERRLARPDLSALRRRVASEGPEQATCSDAAGVLWRLAGAYAAPGPGLAARPDQAQLPAASALRHELAATAAGQAAARARMARPFAAVASAPIAGAEEPSRRVASPAPPATARAAATARAVGTLVHRALEELVLDHDLEAALAQQRARLPQYAAQLGALPDAGVAVTAASALLDRLRSSPLFERLRQLADHVLGREVPVLWRGAAAQAEALAYVSGSIDLLYRDPLTHELVIVDYKTDRVGDEAELAARVAEHLPQGRRYQQALLQALELTTPPRFELWFLGAGRIVSMP
ncbi:MAG: UvrD-helicase domain-containing protein [Proteobacteria bacterium]|nr:UvrD-helicase domain-containing protein [Pseudomonadota bacterium]